MHDPHLIVVYREDVYWRPNRAGYTRHLLEAGLYSKEEAEAQQKSRPEIDRAVSLDAELGRLRINPEVLIYFALNFFK